MKRLIDDPIAAMDLILVDPASDEIERATLPGMASPGRRVLGMDGAHAGNVPEGETVSLSPTGRHLRRPSRLRPCRSWQ